MEIDCQNKSNKLFLENNTVEPDESMFTWDKPFTDDMKVTQEELFRSMGFQPGEYKTAYGKLFQGKGSAISERLKKQLNFDVFQIRLSNTGRAKGELTTNKEKYDLFSLLKLLYKYQKDGEYYKEASLKVGPSTVKQHTKIRTRIISLLSEPNLENITLCFKKSGNDSEPVISVYGELYDELLSEVEKGIRQQLSDEQIKALNIQLLDEAWEWRRICDYLLPAFTECHFGQYAKMNEYKEFLTEYYEKYLAGYKPKEKRFVNGVLQSFYVLLLENQCLCRDAYLQQKYHPANTGAKIVLTKEYIDEYNDMYNTIFDSDLIGTINDLIRSLDDSSLFDEYSQMWDMITYYQGIDSTKKSEIIKALSNTRKILDWTSQECDSYLTEEEREEPIIRLINDFVNVCCRQRQLIATIQEQIYGYTKSADMYFFAIRSQEKRKTYRAGVNGAINQTLARYWVNKVADREAMNSGFSHLIKDKYEVMQILYKYSKIIFSFYSVDDVHLLLCIIRQDLDDMLIDRFDRQDVLERLRMFLTENFPILKVCSMIDEVCYMPIYDEKVIIDYDGLANLSSCSLNNINFGTVRIINYLLKQPTDVLSDFLKQLASCITDIQKSLSPSSPQEEGNTLCCRSLIIENQYFSSFPFIKEFKLNFIYITSLRKLVLTNISVNYDSTNVQRIKELGFGDMVKWFTEE